jgi:hypothetical protein
MFKIRKQFCSKQLWGQLVKLRPIGNRPTPVTNRRQDAILPHILSTQQLALVSRKLYGIQAESLPQRQSPHAANIPRRSSTSVAGDVCNAVVLSGVH